MKSISINLTLGVMYCVMLKTLKQVKDNALRWTADFWLWIV